MTETAAQSTNIDLEWKNAAYCPKCKINYGTEFEGYLLPILARSVDDNGVLVISWLKIDKISGECMKCGEPIWWTSSERYLNKIVKEKKRRSDE